MYNLFSNFTLLINVVYILITMCSVSCVISIVYALRRWRWFVQLWKEQTWAQSQFWGFTNYQVIT